MKKGPAYEWDQRCYVFLAVYVFQTVKSLFLHWTEGVFPTDFSSKPQFSQLRPLSLRLQKGPTCWPLCGKSTSQNSLSGLSLRVRQLFLTTCSCRHFSALSPSFMSSEQTAMYLYSNAAASKLATLTKKIFWNPWSHHSADSPNYSVTIFNQTATAQSVHRALICTYSSSGEKGFSAFRSVCSSQV